MTLSYVQFRVFVPLSKSMDLEFGDVPYGNGHTLKLVGSARVFGAPCSHQNLTMCRVYEVLLDGLWNDDGRPASPKFVAYEVEGDVTNLDEVLIASLGGVKKHDPWLLEPKPDCIKRHFDDPSDISYCRAAETDVCSSDCGVYRNGRHERESPLPIGVVAAFMGIETPPEAIIPRLREHSSGSYFRARYPALKLLGKADERPKICDATMFLLRTRDRGGISVLEMEETLYGALHARFGDDFAFSVEEPLGTFKKTPGS